MATGYLLSEAAPVGTVNAPAGLASGVGTAYQAAGSLPVTNAPAGSAAGTGIARTPSLALTRSAGLASATGAAYDATAGTGWHSVPLGAGGFITGIDVAADGVTVARTDTYGAYAWNRTTSRWRQTVSAVTMPSADRLPFSSFGVYEICVAPSNTTTFYVAWKNSVYKSTNSGASWTVTALTGKTFDANDGHRYRGRKMAVDPQNDQVVYFGVPADGVYVTTNGGTSWTKDSGIPASGAAGYQIVFDPASTVTSSRQQKIFVGIAGTGVYKTSNAGTSWSSLASAPTAIGRMICLNNGSTGTDSTVLATQLDSNVYRWSGGSWSTVAVGARTWWSLACNPALKTQIVVGDDGGYLAQSSDGGATWIDQGGGNHILFNRTMDTSATIPWHGWSNEINYLSNGEMVFDPLNSHGSGTLFFAEGIGVFWTNMLTSDSANKTVAWTGMSLGIEQLVVNEIIKIPTGNLAVDVMDRCTFIVDSGMATYPSVYWPDKLVNLRIGFGLAVSNDGYVYSLNGTNCARSTDKGVTWASITTPTGYGGGAGSICVDPQNHQNVVVVYSGSSPYYSTNGGTSWTAGTGATAPSIGTYDKRVLLAADPVTSGTFYLYADAGLYKSTNNGATWALSFTKGTSGTAQSDVFVYTVGATCQMPPGSHDVWLSGGQKDGWPDSLTPSSQVPFIKFTSAGTVANVLSNVLEVYKFGFGKPSGAGYPALYIVGWVNSVYGVWRSDDADQTTPTWTNLGTWPNDSFDNITSVAGDPDTYGRVYIGFNGSGAAYRDA